jgi:hypothetical protein
MGYFKVLLPWDIADKGAVCGRLISYSYDVLHSSFQLGTGETPASPGDHIITCGEHRSLRVLHPLIMAKIMTMHSLFTTHIYDSRKYNCPTSRRIDCICLRLTDCWLFIISFPCIHYSNSGNYLDIMIWLVFRHPYGCQPRMPCTSNESPSFDKLGDCGEINQPILS